MNIRIIFLAILLPIFSTACISTTIRKITKSNSDDNLSLATLAGGTIPLLSGSATFVTTFRLTNTSSNTLNISAIDLIDDGLGHFSLSNEAPCNSLPLSLSAGSSCILKLTSIGDTSWGSFDSNIKISYLDSKNISKNLTSNTISAVSSSVPHMMASTMTFPTDKIEILIGDDSPHLEHIDLYGVWAAGNKMSITDEYLIPGGLTFDINTGSITGSPTTAGNHTIEACSVYGGVKTTDCISLTYKIISERTILASNQRPSATSNATCSSASGIGSNSNPILISTANDLNTCVRNYPKAAFKLMADISLAAYPASSFQPLGNFYGIFDGNSHTISDYTWSRAVAGSSATGTYGLFNSLELKSVVKNLNLSSFNLTTSNSSAGILAGYSRGAIIRNISITNSTLSCTMNCGGVIGSVFHPGALNLAMDPAASTDYIDGYTNRISTDNLTISAPSSASSFWLANAGGHIGSLFGLPFRISRSSSTNLHLSAANLSGGIIGASSTLDPYSDSATSHLWIDSSSSSGNILQSGGRGSYHGGLIGMALSGDFITNSYSIANMGSNLNAIAGLIGGITDSPNGLTEFTLSKSYFNGTINTSAMALGTLIGGTSGFTTSNLIHLTQTRHVTSTDPIIYGIDGVDFTMGWDSDNGAGSITISTAAEWADSNHFTQWSSPPWTGIGSTTPTLSY